MDISNTWLGILAAVSGAAYCGIVAVFINRLYESRLVALIVSITLGFGGTWQALGDLGCDYSISLQILTQE